MAKLLYWVLIGSQLVIKDMPPLFAGQPDLGLDSRVSENALTLRHASRFSQNILYEYGILRTPEGFSKLDLTTGLNSGDIVLDLFPFTELDGYGHLIAATTQKIYIHDKISNEWDDITQSGITMSSNIEHPISSVEVGHDDTDIYIDDDTAKNHSYHHVLICDGGMSNIQRWAGRYEADCANLLGGGGYHEGTTHRALQVSMSQKTRIMLVSPKEYESSSKLWIENNQRIRWPAIGKIQTWSGTGSGFVDLIDTNGINVWSAPLGGQHIIYQTNGIWTLNYVGGTTVFNPVPMIPDLGLLGNRLLINHNNIHYFIGTDYNIYAYYGGSVLKSIGDPIHKYLQEDLDPHYDYRCIMLMGPKSKRLWIYIVPGGDAYATKAYIMDMRTQAWMIRDFKHKYATATSGITAAISLPADSYESGDTYQEQLDLVSLHPAADETESAGDITIRYGDDLLDASRTISFDPTNASWCAGGLRLDGSAGCNYKSEFTANDILFLEDGSRFLKDTSYICNFGDHFFTVYDVTAGYALVVPRESSEGTARLYDLTPAEISFSLWQPSGKTYNQVIEEIKVDEKMIIGDSAGLVYQFDNSVETDDVVNIPCRHITPPIDWAVPHLYKRWTGVSITAESTAVTPGVYFEYRTAYFDTSESGWSSAKSLTLDSTWQEKTFFLNVSSKAIQFRFKSLLGSHFQIKDLQVLEPLVEENR